MSNTKKGRKYKGTFTKGNQYWKLRNKHGRNTAYTPDSLLNSFFEYVQWNLENDYFTKEESTIKQENNVIRKVTKTKQHKRPLSKERFNIFLGKGRQYFQDLKKSKAAKGESEFISTISYIENYIEAKQLEGALSYLFKPNIIARMLV